MKSRNLKNKEIDRIGENLLKAPKTSDEEIEKIFANSQLFDSIQARIKAEEQSQIDQPRSFGAWNLLKNFSLNRQLAVSGLAVLFVFTVFAGLSLVKDQPESAQNIQNPIKSSIKEEVKKAEIISENQPTDIKKDFVDEQIPIEKHVAVKTVSSKTTKRIKQTDLVKAERSTAKNPIESNSVNQTKKLKKESPQVAKTEPQKVFYSLPFVAGSQTADEKLQIISTELSKSDLFALGINVQLENEVSSVNAELLIGADGVARAIRLVE